jgi:glycosyltransferase involved in cell wall biosynthesis
MNLSAAIIVKDEAENLDACLTSLHGLVDEIVVVDTGSTDASVDVARRHGAIVGHEPWRSNFSTPRNRALDLATGDWILYIDADERVRAGNHAAVREHLRSATHHVSFRVRFVPRVNWTPYREFRLWRHHPDIRFVGAIHETTLPGLTNVARREHLLIADLDTLTIEHLGYEGDQRHKHARNEPILRCALKNDPQRVYLYDHLARIYEDLRDDERARATWRSGIAVARERSTDHPDDKLLWVNLVVHLAVREDPDGDLEALLGEARDRYPNSPALDFAVALREFVSGDAAGAARRFEQLVALDPDALIATGTSFDGRIFNEWSWHSLGLCRFSYGDFAGAAEAFRLAESADPENAAYRTRRMLAEARAVSASGR